MKRFYAEAGFGTVDGGFAVTLDGKPVRTPGKQLLRVPTRALAEAVSAEWRRQPESIDPASMPLTRLANSAVDGTAPNRIRVIDQVAAYAGSDMLCYRAEAPEALRSRQQAAWQPLLDWLAERFGAALGVTEGIVPVAQDEEALRAVYVAVAACDDFRLTGLHAATAATGSVVLALALAETRIDADAAWRAAHLDELYQVERWGDDPAAAGRRQALRDDIAAAARFMALSVADG